MAKRRRSLLAGTTSGLNSRPTHNQADYSCCAAVTARVQAQAIRLVVSEAQRQPRQLHRADSTLAAAAAAAQAALVHLPQSIHKSLSRAGDNQAKHLAAAAVAAVSCHEFVVALKYLLPPRSLVRSCADKPAVLAVFGKSKAPAREREELNFGKLDDDASPASAASGFGSLASASGPAPVIKKRGVKKSASSKSAAAGRAGKFGLGGNNDEGPVAGKQREEDRELMLLDLLPFRVPSGNAA